MTVTTTASSVTVLGNGSTSTFDYGFEIPVDAVNGDTWASLTLTDSNGNETVLAQNLWSITGLGNASGGTFTYPLSGSPIANGSALTLARAIPATQQTSFGNQGRFNITTVEGALDYLTMLIQDVINAPVPQILPVNGVAHAESPYQLQATDALVWARTSTGTITIDAPADPVNGQVYTVVDADDEAATSNVTIGFAIGTTATPKITTNGGSLKFAWNGVSWSFVP